MKVFRILGTGLYSQVHCVVADTYAEVEKLWEQEYKSSPEGIEVYSEYVIVKGQKD